MLANGIKQTTATTGTGSLTLAAVSGAPKLSDAFPIGVRFAYTLLDAAGLFLEAGIGYLSDATTMVRARVAATFTGSSYANSSPTAVSLTGTTTVICTPHAATLESMLPTVDSVSSGVMRLITGANRNLQTQLASITGLRIYYVPALLRVSAPIASLAVNVTTAAAAGVVSRLGIYACGEDGYPGVLLATTGDIDMSSTGIKNVSLSPKLPLPPGQYFLAYVGSASATVMCYQSGNQNQMGGWSLGLNATLSVINARVETVTSAVLPAMASRTTSGDTVSPVPLVFLGPE